MAKLNVGGGKGHPRLEGWSIVDLRKGADVKLDITSEPLPFADSSVDLIFTSHTLEHIEASKLGFVLDEFHRVLSPGTGLLRVAVPDIELAVRAYAAKDRSFFERGDITYRDREAPIGGMLASWFYSVSAVGNGHVHCFDFEYMRYWLETHGFSAVSRSTYRASAVPELRAEAFDRHPHESLFVEARKAA